MRISGTIAIIAGLLVSSTASSAMSNQAACPKFEAGAAYPWQNWDLMPGDHYAWVYIEIDKTGRALKCSIGENNILDPETRFRLCRAYSEDWRGPPAAAGDPERRTINRHFTLLGAAHELANQKARKQFQGPYPEERPSCYPE